MNDILVLLIQVSLLLILPCLVIVSIWVGSKVTNVLDAHLERFQATLQFMVKQQNSHQEMLSAILAKLIVLQAIDK